MNQTLNYSLICFSEMQLRGLRPAIEENDDLADSYMSKCTMC